MLQVELWIMVYTWIRLLQIDQKNEKNACNWIVGIKYRDVGVFNLHLRGESTRNQELGKSDT